MSFTPTRFPLVLALLLAPGIAISQAALPAHAMLASDPNAPAPAVQFRSVFQDTPKGVVADTLDWKKANAEVGQFSRGHSDVLKWENTPAPATGAPGPASPAMPMKH